MYRTREFRRDIRNRKIARKKRISRAILGYDWYLKDEYSSSNANVGETFSDYLNRINAGCDGRYSKGKIHCSCRMCTYSKSYDLPRFKDYINRDRFKSAIDDYITAV